ncbi:MAG TPA: acyltransferase family protein [Rhizobiaceae bacterium]
MATVTSPEIPPPASPARRYDLDWLRVFAFGMLIFYHVGMFYVTWGWHVKSRYSSTLLEPAMGLTNPWRLALLFFISGVAIRFVMDKAPMRRFLPGRIVRLAVPIVFGMAVVVMPQAYAELRYRGEIPPGLLSFYGQYLSFGDFSIIVPTWNHLWYVVYILVYTLLAAALLPLLRYAAKQADAVFGFLSRGGAWRVLLVPAVPFVFYRVALEPYFPTTHTLWGDWANIAHTLTIFLIGFMAAKNEDFWRAVDRATTASCALSLVLGGLLLAAWLNQTAVRADPTLLNAVLLLRIFYAWSIIVMLLGLARRFANRPGPALAYLTAAVFPYYILHQTIIVVVGYWFTLHEAPVGVEAAAIVAATVLGCAVGYEIIRRLGPVGMLFGAPLRETRTKRKDIGAGGVRKSASRQPA